MTRLKVSAAHAAPARPLLLIDAGNTRIKWAWIAGGADAEPALPEEPGGTPWQHAGARAHDRLAELVEDWRDCHASGVAPRHENRASGFPPRARSANRRSACGTHWT
jgi:type III pantothenate kinase